MTTATSANYNQHELDKFASLAHRWWDEKGPQKALHAMNPVRLNYVLNHTAIASKKVLDVGCGGGLLSEAMAKAGAKVTGIDLAPELIKIARLHGLESGIEADYRVQSVEALATEAAGSYDVVTCMEMLEHVPDPLSIIRACSTLLKPGGHLFVSTLNRTPAAFALAILGAEYIVKLLPKGTHQYKDFIKPSELAGWLRDAGLALEGVTGVMYEPWKESARLTSRTDVNYMAYAQKLGH